MCTGTYEKRLIGEQPLMWVSIKVRYDFKSIICVFRAISAFYLLGEVTTPFEHALAFVFVWRPHRMCTVSLILA